MKTNKISAVEMFQRDMMILLRQYYSSSISESVNRVLKNKKRLSTDKVAM